MFTNFLYPRPKLISTVCNTVVNKPIVKIPPQFVLRFHNENEAVDIEIVYSTLIGDKIIYNSNQLIYKICSISVIST